VKLLLASPLHTTAVSQLQDHHDVRVAYNASESQFRDAIGDREAVILRSGVQLSGNVLSAAPDLRLIIRAGSGLDNIDVDAARAQGVRVVRVPGVSAQPVAELTFALLLAVGRKIVLADRLLRQGHWPKPDLGGPLLHGKTLGVVGAGNIGGRVGEMGLAWGMTVLGCVESPDEARGRRPDLGFPLTSFDKVVQESDFLSLHVPLQPNTRHLVGDEVLSAMKKGSLLVNMARGGVVDEAALLRCLTAGETLAGAALDVHEREGEGVVPELARLDNVVLTPHIGAMASDAQQIIGERVGLLVSAFLHDRLDSEAQPDELVA